MKTGDIKAVIGNHIKNFPGPEDIAKSHIQAKDFGVWVGLVNCFACSGEETGILGGRSLPESSVWLIPDLPVFDLAGKVFHCFPDKIAVCLNTLRRSWVVEIRSVRQVAEEQKSVFVAHIYKPVIVLELVLSFLFLDSAPGEVLPSPLDACFFHFLQYGFKIRRVGLEGCIDSKGGVRQEVVGKGVWR